MGLAYQNPGGPYKDNISDLPESQYLWWQLFPGNDIGVNDRFSTTTYRKNFNIGLFPEASSESPTDFGLNNPAKVPLWLPPGTATLKNRAMIVYLRNTSASQPAATFRFNAVFDLYTQEQAYASGVMSSPRVYS
jgi:hypothetical protein